MGINPEKDSKPLPLWLGILLILFVWVVIVAFAMMVNMGFDDLQSHIVALFSKG